MAMNLGHRLDAADEDEVIGTINTTPLVDVMLVLLIIFLITIPVVTTSIAVNLPKETNVARATQPDTVIISIDKAGQFYVRDTPVPDAQALQARLKTFAAMTPQPEVQIRGDAQAAFDKVAQVVDALKSVGITQVGFITDPAP